MQGITKRCRLTWLTNSALAYEFKWGVGGWGGELRGLSQSVQLCTGAQINFRDQTPITYGVLRVGWFVLPGSISKSGVLSRHIIFSWRSVDKETKVRNYDHVSTYISTVSVI
jgi:hypothetical protein